MTARARELFSLLRRIYKLYNPSFDAYAQLVDAYIIDNNGGARVISSPVHYIYNLLILTRVLNINFFFFI